MKKKLLLVSMCVLFATSTLLSMAQLQKVASYKLGTAQNEDTTITLRNYAFYDENCQLVRGVDITAGADGVAYTQKIYSYRYDSVGNMIASWSNQYNKAYDKWNASNDSAVYLYDEHNRLINKTTAMKALKYEYDNLGRLISETDSSLTATSNPVNQKIVYTEFDSEGNPLKFTSDGAFSTYRYKGTFTYDEKGRLIEEANFDLTSGAKKARIEYSYDDFGICNSELHYKAGSTKTDTVVANSVADTLLFSKQTLREAISNGWYELSYYTFSKVNGNYTWSKSASSYKELYVDVKASMVATDLSLTNVSTAEAPNTVKVEFVTPDTAPVVNPSYIIWRNSERVATINHTADTIQYVDSCLENGIYEYMIQVYDATNDIYYSVSSTDTIEVGVPLGAVKNVRVVGGYKGKYTDPDPKVNTTYDTYYVKVSWDVEECKYPVKGYRVWVAPYKTPILEIEGDKDTCEISMPEDESMNIRIDAVYDAGVAEGEYVLLFWDNSQDFDGEPVNDYYLTHVAEYGTHMGGNEASGVGYYIYDDQNNISRRVEYGYNTDGTQSPTYQYFYEYNDKHQLVSEYYRQYSALGEWGRHRETYLYTYDNDGRILSREDTTSYVLRNYHYSTAGVLDSIVELGRKRGGTEYEVVKNITRYTEYNEQGLPVKSEYYHPQYASSCYYTSYSYDEKGRLILSESFKLDSTAYEKFAYEYDSLNIETSKTRYIPVYGSDGQATREFVYSSRVVRELQGDAVYKNYTENYNATTETWKASERYTIETYSPLNGALAPKNIKVSDASTAESPNTVKVECNYPDSKIDNAQYIIWRGWIPVDTVAAPATQGAIIFHDVNVENGTYEYMVQTYDATAQKAFNASSPATITINTQLLPVTNLTYIKTESGEYRDPDTGKLPIYWVHFKWDAPNTTLPIMAYNIYQDGFQIPVKTTTNTNDSVWIYRTNAADIDKQQRSTTIEVTVVYALGESDGVSEVFNLELSALEEVTLYGTAYMEGKTLVVEPQSAVTIYNVAGAIVATYDNQARIDLSAQPTGVYVAVVKVGGVNQILKIAL